MKPASDFAPKIGYALVGRAAVLLLLGTGCEPEVVRRGIGQGAPVCYAFDWMTKRADQPVICRMVWCGGPAVLWCAAKAL